jgi:hypothetical protein
MVSVVFMNTKPYGLPWDVCPFAVVSVMIVLDATVADVGSPLKRLMPREPAVLPEEKYKSPLIIFITLRFVEPVGVPETSI